MRRIPTTLTLLAKRSRYRLCDRLSRRSFLQIGGLGLCGLTLRDVLAAEQTAAKPTRTGGLGHKALIMVYLPGGPAHLDTYDLKPQAPSEIRGDLSPIPTTVPGIEISELMPRLAQNMDKLVPIRSLVGATKRHEAYQCFTGRLNRNNPPGGWPEFGSVVSHLQGEAATGLPVYFGLSPRMQFRAYNTGDSGFLGLSHTPFQPMAEGKGDLHLNGSLDRLNDRRKLLASFDRFRRYVDASSLMEGQDQLTQQAFGVLTSSRLATALDVSQEDSRVRARYGTGTVKPIDDAAPRDNQHFLLARRLVEAGARCVTLSYSNWDWHANNSIRVRESQPDFDQAMSALIEDLHERGLAEDVTVIAWGEFGRTPRINERAGRHHWHPVSCALLAGGGMRTGQAIGRTNRDASSVVDRPVHFQEVFATLYRNLGIDVETATIPDLQGRPRYLVAPGYKSIPELV